MMTRIPFETAARAGAVQMLKDYAQDTSSDLQVYPARPIVITPPHAFIESIGEDITWSPGLRQRTIRVKIRIVWGLFDSLDAVGQRDFFIDNFIDWTSDRPHAASGSTIMEPRNVDDEPAFTPDWGGEKQRNTTYFSSTLTLEGFAGGY